MTFGQIIIARRQTWAEWMAQIEIEVRRIRKPPGVWLLLHTQADYERDRAFIDLCEQLEGLRLIANFKRPTKERCDSD